MLVHVYTYARAQSRMIVAENLPEDSSRNSLEKIFGVVGRSGSAAGPQIVVLHASHIVYECIVLCVLYYYYVVEINYITTWHAYICEKSIYGVGRHACAV